MPATQIRPVEGATTVEDGASGVRPSKSKHDTMGETKEEVSFEAESEKPAAAAVSSLVTEKPAAAAEAGKEEVEAKKPAAAVPVVDAAAESDTTDKQELFLDYFIVDPDEYYARRINDPDPFFSREYVERSTQTFRDVAEFCHKAWMGAQGYVYVTADDYSQEPDEDEEDEDEEYEDYYRQAFGPMEGLITDQTPQSVIDEMYARCHASDATSSKHINSSL